MQARLLRLNVQTWLRIHPDTNPGIYGQIFAAAEIASVSYWLEIFFSAGIATFGLVESSPAVIIGAMLISPLMGPIMATGLALAAGDLYRGIKAVATLAASIAASIAFSGFLVWLMPFHSATSEIISRTNPNLLDLGIALFSGLAGSVVVCRAGSDGATALPGVAIAVALMPPLCVMGFGLGSGVDLMIMGGAGLLFLTNLVAIVSSAFLVFLLVGMSGPEAQKAADASPGDGQPVKPSASRPIASALAAGGGLRWRVLMVLILLGSIAVPLRRALLQVASDTSARLAVQAALKELVSSNGIVSQQVTVGNGAIAIRLISTRGISAAKVAQVRRSLKHRTGRDVEISVETVASGSEFAQLMARLSRPAPVISNASAAADSPNDLLDRVRSALDETWPSPDAPLQDVSVVVGTGGVTVNVVYQAPADLGDRALQVVQQSLRNKLAAPELILITKRVPPGAVPARSGGLTAKPRHP
jgi:uncharacterized hydrophobic protein (TIGR00271 family)